MFNFNAKQVLYLLPVALSWALALYFFLLSGHDPERRQIFGERIASIGYADTVLNQQLLESAYGEFHNYDILADYTDQMQRDIHFLKQQALPKQGLYQQLSSIVDNLSVTIEKKQLMIERFKSTNARYKNSLVYFLKIIRDIQQQVRSNPAVSPAARQSMEVMLADLMSETLAYLVENSTNNQGVNEQLMHFNRIEGFPDTLTPYVARLKSHAGRFLEDRKRAMYLLKSLLDIDMAQQLERLDASSFVVYRYETRNFYYSQICLAVGSLFLALWFVYWVWQLYVNARSEGLRADQASIDVQNYQFAIDHHAIVNFVNDKNEVLYANHRFCDLMGVSEDNVVGKQFFDFVIPGLSRNQSHQKILEILSKEGFWQGELILVREGNERRWLQATCVRCKTTDDNEPPIATILTDITDRKAIEEDLFQEKELGSFTLKSIADAVITTDAQGRVAFMNPVAERLSGWTFDEAEGMAVNAVCPINDSEEEIEEEGTSNITYIGDYQTLKHRSGEAITVRSVHSSIHNREGDDVGAVIIFHDAREESELKAELSYQATHDSLTDTINRKEFERRLDELVLQAKHSDEIHTLLYLDLDQFKIVNDTCGHLAGDHLLKQVIELIKKQIRNNDILARLGGDEFAIALFSCSQANAVKVAEKILEALNKYRFHWHSNTFRVGVSIGLTIVDRYSDSATHCLRDADVACYQAKERGRHRLCVYNNDHSTGNQRAEIDWVLRLNDALDKNRFVLFRQPIVDLQGSAEQHYELLLRMRLEDGEIISPGAFIPAAERYKLMSAIDRWVITEAFRLQPLMMDTKTGMWTINL